MIDIGLWVLTAACAATTLLFSFGAKPPGADLFSGADKVGHAIAYFTTTLGYLFAAVGAPAETGLPSRGDGDGSFRRQSQAEP